MTELSRHLGYQVGGQIQGKIPNEMHSNCFFHGASACACVPLDLDGGLVC